VISVQGISKFINTGLLFFGVQFKLRKLFIYLLKQRRQMTAVDKRNFRMSWDITQLDYTATQTTNTRRHLCSSSNLQSVNH